MNVNPYENDESPIDQCDACHSTDDVAPLIVQEFDGPNTKLLCALCNHDRIAQCPGCQQFIWTEDGNRVYGNAHLYCESCAKPILAAESHHALRADEARDDAAQTFLRR